MHSKFIVSDGVVAAVLVIIALANTRLSDGHTRPGQFCIQNIFVPKKIIPKNNQE
jgi:hypothetical protein